MLTVSIIARSTSRFDLLDAMLELMVSRITPHNGLKTALSSFPTPASHSTITSQYTTNISMSVQVEYYGAIACPWYVDILGQHGRGRATRTVVF